MWYRNKKTLGTFLAAIIALAGVLGFNVGLDEAQQAALIDALVALVNAVFGPEVAQ